MICLEVWCEYCEKEFYLNTFRLQEAKTVTCLYCNKRIDNKTKEEKVLEVLDTTSSQEVVGELRK